MSNSQVTRVLNVGNVVARAAPRVRPRTSNRRAQLRPLAYTGGRPGWACVIRRSLPIRAAKHPIRWARSRQAGATPRPHTTSLPATVAGTPWRASHAAEAVGEFPPDQPIQVIRLCAITDGGQLRLRPRGVHFLNHRRHQLRNFGSVRFLEWEPRLFGCGP